jgi:hypothetical protein
MESAIEENILTVIFIILTSLLTVAIAINLNKNNK